MPRLLYADSSLHGHDCQIGHNFASVGSSRNESFYMSKCQRPQRGVLLLYKILIDLLCSIPIPAGVTHRLVREYLLHYGYADTLSAFDSAAGTTEDAPQLGSSRWTHCSIPAPNTPCVWCQQAVACPKLMFCCNCRMPRRADGLGHSFTNAETQDNGLDDWRSALHAYITWSTDQISAFTYALG